MREKKAPPAAALKRALLASVLTSLLIFSAAAGITYAWFSSLISSGENNMISAKLDFEIYSYDMSSGERGERLTDSVNFPQGPGISEPLSIGSSGGRCFLIQNTGQTALLLEIRLKTDDYSGEISSALRFCVSGDSLPGEENWVYLTSPLTNLTPAPIMITDSAVLSVNYEVFADIMNPEGKALTFDADLIVTAVQSNFLTAPGDAVVFVLDARQFADALQNAKNGATIILAAEIDFGEGNNVLPVCNSYNVDLNGFSIISRGGLFFDVYPNVENFALENGSVVCEALEFSRDSPVKTGGDLEIKRNHDEG